MNSVRLLCLPSSGRIISSPLTIVKLSSLSRLWSDDIVCWPIHLITLGFGLRMHWLKTSLLALIKINFEIHTNTTISDSGTIFHAIFTSRIIFGSFFFWRNLFFLWKIAEFLFPNKFFATNFRNCCYSSWNKHKIFNISLENYTCSGEKSQNWLNRIETAVRLEKIAWDF